jgi:hypothetical protein
LQKYCCGVQEKVAIVMIHAIRKIRRRPTMRLERLNPSQCSQNVDSMVKLMVDIGVVVVVVVVIVF